MRLSILENVKSEALKRYDELKGFTNTDEGKEMIVFVSRTIQERHINDLRDEDRDEFIGISKSGWILYTHDIEYFQGPIKIKNETVQKMTSEEVLNYIEELNDSDYIWFMKKVCEIYKNI